MTTFDERENAFEKQFAHDQDLQFRATAHRNRAVGTWAAGKLGKTGADAETYAQSLVAAGIAKAGDAVILDKLEADLKAGNIAIPRAEIAATLSRLGSEAVTTLKK